MNALVSAVVVIAIIILIHFVLSKALRRPTEWIRYGFFAAGFGIAIFLNEYFAITGITKYLVIAVAVAAFDYVGQTAQKRKRTAA